MNLVDVNLLESLKEEHCIIVIKDDNDLKKYKQIKKLQKDFENCIIVNSNRLEELLLNELLENIVPSYMVIKEGNLEEIGIIIY